MTHDELNIDLKTEDGGSTLVFRLRGSLDLATAPTVRAALVEATEGGSHHLIVDLTQLEFLDSTGLGVLVGVHRRTAERDGSLRLVVNEGPISRLLSITGLIAVFAVFRSLDDAKRDRNRISGSL
ncbi:MAG TPA: STAS domain-containing protein [Candidatus Cybelea sp.]|jgi:anti-sigma B factor antagonist|nr:STAS domain-containing protein [Candidatus Cybelea sp.]